MRAFLKTLVLGLAFIVLAGPLAAQTLEEAIQKFNSGNFEDALSDWQALADSGDADALFNLGQMYRQGQGISFDFPKAEEAYTQAAQAGHTAAQRELGNLYFFSIGTDDAKRRAIPWWQAAAANGDAKAQYILGILFFNGDIVAHDRIRGYAWTLLAMDGGVPEALQSNTAMRSQLSEQGLAVALNMAPTLMTGTPNQGLYSVLIGEPFPRPRTIIAEINGSAPQTEPEPEIEATPVETMASEPPPPLELPASDPPAQAEALDPIQESATQFETAEAISTDQPEVQDALAEVIEVPEETPTLSEPEPEVTEPEPQVAEPVTIAPEDYDLGDPLSALVDQEGFDGAWSIQLTSFRRPENAEAHWQDVSNANPDLFALLTKKILRFDLGPERGIYYRLRIGPFLDKEEADAKCLEITEAGLSCLVIWP